MVKLYKNRFIRKYHEDFLLSLFSKATPVTALGQNILQKYKYSIIGKSIRKQDWHINKRYRLSKMLRYLAIRTLCRFSYLWVSALSLLKIHRRKKRLLTYLNILKFKRIFLRLMLINRHALLHKDIQCFYRKISGLARSHMFPLEFGQLIYLPYLFNWNKGFDFTLFSQLKRNTINDYSYFGVRFSISSYQYTSSLYIKSMSFQASTQPTLLFNAEPLTIKAVRDSGPSKGGTVKLQNTLAKTLVDSIVDNSDYPGHFK